MQMGNTADNDVFDYGCELHLVSEPLKNPAEHKNCYVFIKNNNSRSLYYFGPNGACAEAKIVDFNLFEEKINSIKSKSETKLHLSEQQIQEIIESNVHHTSSYSAARIEAVIFHCTNYCALEPTMLTYNEAIKLITQSGPPESLLRNDAIKNGVCFLMVDPQDTRTQKLKNTYNLDDFPETNNSNGSYKIRYKGYEQLNKETIEELFRGKTISTKAIPIEHINIENRRNAAIKAQDKDGNPIFGTFIGRSLEVQTTDMETKNHLKRRILSCIQHMPDGAPKRFYEFRLKDTYYPQEYIEALISNLEAEKTSGAILCPEEAANANSCASNIEKIAQNPVKKRRARGLKHPEFYQYVQFQVESYAYSFTAYLNMMKNMGYVSGDYQSYRIAAKKDKSHSIIHDVSIGRNNQGKEIIFFRVNQGTEIHEILMGTVKDYFTNAIRKICRK